MQLRKRNESQVGSWIPAGHLSPGRTLTTQMNEWWLKAYQLCICIQVLPAGTFSWSSSVELRWQRPQLEIPLPPAYNDDCMWIAVYTHSGPKRGNSSLALFKLQTEHVWRNLCCPLSTNSYKCFEHRSSLTKRSRKDLVTRGNLVWQSWRYSEKHWRYTGSTETCRAIRSWSCAKHILAGNVCRITNLALASNPANMLVRGPWYVRARDRHCPRKTRKVRSCFFMDAWMTWSIGQFWSSTNLETIYCTLSIILWWDTWL